MDYIKCIENLVISNIYTMAKRTLNSFKFQPDTPVILCCLQKTKFKARRGIGYRFAHKRGMFCWGTQYFKKITYNHARSIQEKHNNERGECVHVPSQTEAEALSNAVDVVELLRDPTDPSTERTAPPRSAHAQLDDVPRTLDPVEDEGEFRQHNGVAMVMMMLPAQGFA